MIETFWSIQLIFTAALVVFTLLTLLFDVSENTTQKLVRVLIFLGIVWIISYTPLILFVISDMARTLK